MKNLHNTADMFEELARETSDHYNIDINIIKHDYFVSYVLREIALNIPNIVFKGGTSLSKCFNLIQRYSEDIDLTIMCSDELTIGKLKEINRTVQEVIEALGFDLKNNQDFKSGRKNNTYIAELVDNNFSNRIKVETFFSVKSYPTERINVGNYIYAYLKKIDKLEIVNDYNIAPFEINAQSLTRTFIDKLFAVCDYKTRNVPARNSRHIYDLYKLFDKIEFNNAFYNLMKEVRTDRKLTAPNVNVSSLDGFDIKKCLRDVNDSNFFRSDYNNITSMLLFENVDYKTAIDVIGKILDKLS